MNILGQSLSFNQTSNVGNQRFGEESKIGTTDNSDVSLIANNVEFLKLDVDSGEIKLGDNISFEAGSTSKVPKYGWQNQLDDAVKVLNNQANHYLNYLFTPSDISLVLVEVKAIELVGTTDLQFGMAGYERLYSTTLNKTFGIEATPTHTTIIINGNRNHTSTITTPNNTHRFNFTLRNNSSGARLNLLITKFEIDGVDYYDIVEPVQANNPEALRIGDLTINTLDNKIEASQLEVGVIETRDISNVITLKSASADSVALEGQGSLESQWQLADDAGMTSSFSENGQVETLTFTQAYSGVIINQGFAIVSTTDGASETNITFKSISTVNDTDPYHGIGIGRLTTVPPLGNTPDDLFDDWFMLYKIKGNNKNPTMVNSPLRGSIRDESHTRARDLAWYPINNTYQIRISVEGGRAYIGAIKTSGSNTFPTYWYSADLTRSPGTWVVFYYGIVAGTLSTAVHHTQDTEDIIVAGWPINETLTRLSASRPLLTETLTLDDDELTLDVPITIVEKNSCSLPSFTKDGDQTFRKTIINNWGHPEFKTLETEINPSSTEASQLSPSPGGGITLDATGTVFTKNNQQLKGSLYTEQLDFSNYDYDLEFEITTALGGGVHCIVLCENDYNINLYRENGSPTNYGPQLQFADGSGGSDGGTAFYGKGFQLNTYNSTSNATIRSTDLSANTSWSVPTHLLGNTIKFVIRKLPTNSTKLYIKEFYRNGVLQTVPEVSWDLGNGLFYAGYLDLNGTQRGTGGGRFNITKIYLAPEDLKGLGVVDTVYTEEGDLWAVGGIDSANDETVYNLAKFTQGDWEPVGLGDGPSFDLIGGTPQVLFWDDRKLYIGGNHVNVKLGQTTSVTHGFSIYNETLGTWTLANQSMTGSIKTINKVSDVIYVAGSFSTIHNNAANFIAEYDNGQWTRPIGFNNTVFCSTQIGDVIYYGGVFTQTSTGSPLSNLCEYNYNKGGNGILSQLGLGVNNAVYAMDAFGTNLYIGGSFTQAEVSSKVIPTTYFTKYDTATGIFYPYTGLNGNVTSIRVISDDLAIIAGDFTQPSNKICLLQGRQFKRLDGFLVSDSPQVRPMGDNTVVFSSTVEGLIKSISSDVTITLPDGHVELLPLGEKKDYIVVSTDNWM